MCEPLARALIGLCAEYSPFPALDRHFHLLSFWILATPERKFPGEALPTTRLMSTSPILNYLHMKTHLVIIITIVAAGCATKTEPVVVDENAAQATTVASAAPVRNDLYSDGTDRIIKTANYRFEVENIDKSVSAIEEAMRKHQAFIASSDLSSDGPFTESKITLRVPSDSFHDLLNEIGKQAKHVNFRDIKTEDVSKQFVDLESRLKTKREVEQRYMDILRKRAGTIEELLSAERQIGQLHEEIEATISRINYLKDAVRYSTINLQMYQRSLPQQAANDPSPLQEMRIALISGWNSLVVVVTHILYIWPFVLMVGGGLVIYRLRRQRRLVKPA